MGLVVVELDQNLECLFLLDNPGEAKKYFGAAAKNNVDYEIIAPAKGGSIRSTKLGRFEDIDAKIKPVDEYRSSKTRRTREL